MRNNNKLTVIVILIIGFIFTARPLQAHTTTIDFEEFADLTPIGAVNTGDNIVTFSVGAPGALPAYIAKVGAPMTAFVRRDRPAGMTTGTFLTDEIAGPRLKLDYFITFDKPVSSLSLDLYDYRVDGGPARGDTATLTIFSDLFTTPIDRDDFTIPRRNPIDGNVEHLSVYSGSFNILSASLTFSGPDVGTGIDNIAFSSVPAPGAILLSSIGTILVGWLRRHKTL